MRTLLRTLVLGSYLAWPGILVAQPPSPPLPPATTGQSRPETGRPTVPPRDTTLPSQDTKDPTVPSERIRELLNASKANTPAAAPKLPTVLLKGRIISGKRRPPAALLEVEGHTFTVTKGAALVAGPNLILRVLEVSSEEVRLEIDPLKQVIVLQ